MARIKVKYKWQGDLGQIVSRTIDQITVPRIGEYVKFDAGGRFKNGIVKDINWNVTADESSAEVILE